MTSVLERSGERFAQNPVADFVVVGGFIAASPFSLVGLIVWRPLSEASQGPCNQIRTFTSQVSLPGSIIRRGRTGRSARLATKESSDSAFYVEV